MLNPLLTVRSISVIVSTRPVRKSRNGLCLQYRQYCGAEARKCLPQHANVLYEAALQNLLLRAAFSGVLHSDMEAPALR
jgi:hypothetical protein